MKIKIFTPWLLLFPILSLLIVSCSSDDGATLQTPEEPEQMEDPMDGNTTADNDMDNDGINDNEDVDDDGDGLIESFFFGRAK